MSDSADSALSALTSQTVAQGRIRVPKGWRLVLVIGGLSIFGPLCIDMYLPSLPRISRDLHASTSSVQLTLTMCLVGIAAGQLLIGPVSDRIGRRRPLLAGICAFVVSSLVCSVVTNVYLLDASRFVEGLGGAAGIVISRAIVRDLFEGPRAARFFSTLMLVTGVGPILAPQIGAEILRITSWRGVFVALAIIGSALFFSALLKVPETLPFEARHSGGMQATFRAVSVVGRDRTFIGYALVITLGFGAILAYIAGSPFVLQNIYGLSPQVFGLAFALNAGGLVIGSQVNGYLVHRIGSRRLLSFGLTVMAVAGLLFLGDVSTHWLGLWAVIPLMFLVLFGMGFVGPNALTLAMQNHPNAAGVASALLGSAQFLFAAAIAPLVGIAGNHTAIPMGLVMAFLTASAFVVYYTVPTRKTTLTVPVDPAPAPAV